MLVLLKTGCLNQWVTEARGRAVWLICHSDHGIVECCGGLSWKVAGPVVVERLEWSCAAARGLPVFLRCLRFRGKAFEPQARRVVVRLHRLQPRSFPANRGAK